MRHAVEAHFGALAAWAMGVIVHRYAMFPAGRGV
jgi:hypothetical protein